MTNSLGVAEDFGPERGQPPGFHVGPIRACDRFYPWEPNYRFSGKPEPGIKFITLPNAIGRFINFIWNFRKSKCEMK